MFFSLKSFRLSFYALSCFLNWYSYFSEYSYSFFFFSISNFIGDTALALKSFFLSFFLVFLISSCAFFVNAITSELVAFLRVWGVFGWVISFLLFFFELWIGMKVFFYLLTLTLRVISIFWLSFECYCSECLGNILYAYLILDLSFLLFSILFCITALVIPRFLITDYESDSFSLSSDYYSYELSSNSFPIPWTDLGLL